MPGLAAEPRSAIPWLSESVAPAAIPPPRRPADGNAPPPAGSDAITVTPLADISRDAVGLLPPEETGFPRGLWGPATAPEVRDLILAHQDSGMPAARALFRRILLAEADPPRSAGEGSSVLVARIDRLLEGGTLEEAGALLDQAGPDTPELFRRWFDVGLLLNRAEPPCAALRENPTLSPTLPARVFCLARGGDWNAAEITLILGEEIGSIPDGQELLLARFLDPELFEGEPDPPVPDPLTALDFLMREAVGLPRPPGALPLAFLHHDLDEHAPLRARLMAAERLALSGAIDHAALFAVYRSGVPAASGGVWDRAGAVQALDTALAANTAGVGAALVAADAALRGRGLSVALAQDYAPALAGLDPVTLDDAARPVLAELLLLGGEPAAAARAAGASPDARLRAALRIAGGAGADRVLPEDDLARAALGGLSAEAPGDEREQRLARLLADGRTGEAILAALDLVRAGTAADPQALRAALFTLRRAGQEDGARAIAVETLLLRPAG